MHCAVCSCPRSRRWPSTTVEFHLGPIMDEEGKEYESVSPLVRRDRGPPAGSGPHPHRPAALRGAVQVHLWRRGLPICTIMYSLNKKGPCEVYSGDLEPLGDARFRVKDELIPIVRLGPGQAILVYASAELGKGKEHAKWQVTSGTGYKYLPSVKIDSPPLRQRWPLHTGLPQARFRTRGREGQSGRRGVMHHVHGLRRSRDMQDTRPSRSMEMPPASSSSSRRTARWMPRPRSSPP